jgi:hypothetical protein
MLAGDHSAVNQPSALSAVLAQAITSGPTPAVKQADTPFLKPGCWPFDTQRPRPAILNLLWILINQISHNASICAVRSGKANGLCMTFNVDFFAPSFGLVPQARGGARPASAEPHAVSKLGDA